MYDSRIAMNNSGMRLDDNEKIQMKVVIIIIKTLLKRIKFDATAKPMVITVGFVYLSTLLLQESVTLTKEAISGFTIVMILFSINFVYHEIFFRSRQWIYFIIQGLIVFDCAVIMNEGFEAIFLGLIPLLIAQSVSIYRKRGYVLLIIFLYYALFSGIIILYDGFSGIHRYLPILILMTVAIWVYNTMFNNQVALRRKSQIMARELETAYTKVEELTRENERERVARDLHDTLSQGVTALVLQLEAVSANLENGQIERAKEIVSHTSSHARETLSESRAVLQALREPEIKKVNFREKFEAEILRFKHLYNGRLDVDIRLSDDLKEAIGNQVVLILRESLNNIYKHAKASQVSVLIYCHEDVLTMKISDNGIGFSQGKIKHFYGHFGIIGMEERIKSINGKLEVMSKKKQGTTIDIRVPL